ncbi:MAG: LamG domain-containing protein [Solirubrobacteraceae bacterium]
MSRRASGTGVLRRTAALAGTVGVTAVLVVGVGAAMAAEDPSLIGQWRFDESDGQIAADDGPQGLSGRLGTSDLPDAADPGRIAGASGRALRFDGSTFVRLPDTGALAVPSLTTEAVARADASPGPWRYLVSRGGTGCLAGSYGLYTAAAGGVAFYVFDGARYVVSATARPSDVWNGGWHHVAGTFDGSELRLFVDGRPVGEPMDAPLRIEYAGVSPRASFGHYVGECQLSFSGDMDLVRLWSGARSAEAIAQTAPGVPPAPAGAGPLPAAAPGTVIAAEEAARVRERPAASGGRGCVVKVVRRRARGKRVTVVHVRVTARKRPLPATAVVARRTGRRKVLARARTDGHGRARLALRSGRVSITAKRRAGCTPARVRVRPA